MEHFEGATTVRLMGAHGKYLWADQDHYNVSQDHEDKHEQALWVVERPKTGSKTLRLKSCFNTYLNASRHHFHGLASLSFSGKRVTQMRPANVESTNTFDWEPVMEGGGLKLKSCYGTYLRANVRAPPWNNSVSHDLPQHQIHHDWLVWEVRKVRIPNIVPLELVIGQIHLTGTAKHPPVEEKSKYPGEVAARRADKSERLQGTSKYPGEAAVRRVEESKRHSAQGRVKNPGAVPNRGADQSERHPVKERSQNPGVATTTRADKSERRRKHVTPAETPEEAIARRLDEWESERRQMLANSETPDVSRARRAYT